MPRKSRIDAPGAVNHIMARGIERREIFKDNKDRHSFLKRLGTIVMETDTPCFAWVLMHNHFHLLLRTGSVPIATVMRRLLTGHAAFYNRRHGRCGHLFQNRYKSILCQEDAYLLELVRYIHLNPIRGNVVQDVDKLDRYPFSGHSVIMGKTETEWQDVTSILVLFGTRLAVARERYREFVQKGITQGRRDDLTGGGLVRSSGGWAAVSSMRRMNVFQKSDERILGDGDFVEQVLSAAQEHMEKRNALRTKGYTLDALVVRVSDLMKLEPSDIWAPGKQRERVRARSLLCHWAVRYLGISGAELSRQLNMSSSGMSECVRRGEKIARDNGYQLLEEESGKPRGVP